MGTYELDDELVHQFVDDGSDNRITINNLCFALGRQVKPPPIKLVPHMVVRLLGVGLLSTKGDSLLRTILRDGTRWAYLSDDGFRSNTSDGILNRHKYELVWSPE